MNMLVVGISHKTAPIDIRERFYLTETERELLLSTYQSDPSVVEVIVLSTCNRVEIYAHVLDNGINVRPFIELICQIKKVPLSREIENYFYTYFDQRAVNHLLEVSAGLDCSVNHHKRQRMPQSLNSRRRILPTLVLGSSSLKTMTFGRL